MAFPDPSQDFIPGKASPSELLRLGFPADPKSEKGLAIWKDILRASRKFCPLSQSTTFDPYLSETWSGAIVPDPSPNTISEVEDKFYYITSTWNIADACPPPDGTPQGHYACYSFVGFDGWVRDGPPALMWGTKSIFDCGKHLAKVFVQFDSKQETFDVPWVGPGDLVSAVVSVDYENSTFLVYLVNRNTGDYTRQQFPLPSDFLGATAEWILGRQDLDYGNPGYPTELLPNYGAVYYANNFADAVVFRSKTQVPQDYQIDNAHLIDMVDTKSSQIISTALKVGENLLMVYAYNDF